MPPPGSSGQMPSRLARSPSSPSFALKSTRPYGAAAFASATPPPAFVTTTEITSPLCPPTADAGSRTAMPPRHRQLPLGRLLPRRLPRLPPPRPGRPHPIERHHPRGVASDAAGRRVVERPHPDVVGLRDRDAARAAPDHRQQRHRHPPTPQAPERAARPTLTLHPLPPRAHRSRCPRRLQSRRRTGRTRLRSHSENGCRWIRRRFCFQVAPDVREWAQRPMTEQPSLSGSPTRRAGTRASNSEAGVC